VPLYVQAVYFDLLGVREFEVDETGQGKEQCMHYAQNTMNSHYTPVSTPCRPRPR
jgi:hypothetical protein